VKLERNIKKKDLKLCAEIYQRLGKINKVILRNFNGKKMMYFSSYKHAIYIYIYIYISSSYQIYYKIIKS
jgi:hypothetical protein